ncbi:MAG: hypothetical protein ACREH3_13935 [Geminicoccales bacterium]
MARLNWAKNEQLRRIQRFGSAPVGVGGPLSSGKKKRKNKKPKKAKRRPSTASAPPVRAETPSDHAELNAPDALERFRQELAHLDQEIFGLEKELLRQRRRRAAVMAALKKITPRGKAIHAEKLIPAAEAANRKMRRRRKIRPAPQPSGASKST